MKKLRFIVLPLIVLMALSSCNTKSNNDSKDIAEDSNEAKFDGDREDDADFVVEAADGGLLEVQLGLLAQHNSLVPEVKQLGKMMVDDHSKANEELRDLASKKGISIPTSMSDAKQRKYEDMASKTGSDFDEAYTELMVKDHKEDIDKFKKEFDKGTDDDLQTWASNKVPTLEHHLDMAQQAERIVKDKKKNNRTSLDK